MTARRQEYLPSNLPTPALLALNTLLLNRLASGVSFEECYFWVRPGKVPIYRIRLKDREDKILKYFWTGRKWKKC